MTYFLLSITNRCGKSCSYCVVKTWLNNPEYPDKATAQDFMDFLAQAMQSGDTVEITGGGPTLFPDLLLLLDFLKRSNAKAILRTNGAMLGEWRKDYPNMIVVLAKHDSSDNYMASRKDCLLPHDLILDGIPDVIKQKEKYKPVFKADEISPLARHGYNRNFFITNDGKVRFMPCSEMSAGNIVERQYAPTPVICKDHSQCPYMLGAWNLVRRLGQSD